MPPEYQKRELVGGSGLRAALGETLDIHSVFVYTKWLNQGIDAHFDCRIWGGELPPRGAKASDYWMETVPPNVGMLTSAGLDGVSVYSKNAFTMATFETTLPDPDTLTATFMGFEDGSRAGTGMASFMFHRPAGVSELFVYAGGHFSNIHEAITWALPADHLTATHVYTVHLLRPWSEFYIDDTLVCVAINSPNLNFTVINGPPYTLMRGNAPYSRPQLALLEIIGPNVELPLHPRFARLSNIPELPPRTFRLYQTGTNTLLAGLAVDPDVTSHPVPIFGYSSKTLLFRADEAGTLSIEVLTQEDNWREYVSLAVAANTLLPYIMTVDATLVRIVFTPDAPPATITDAEMILR